MVCTVGALAVLAAPTIASAHVTANPNTAQQGGYAKITFRVPGERDNASTTQVEINFPADHPLTSVSTRAVPGWTVQVTKTPLAKPLTADGKQLTEAVSKIVWTGAKIAPGQFEEFDVSMGPLPEDTGQMVFKALQTYDNGEVVRWIDTETAGAPEPSHPAPVVKLVPKNAAVTAAAVSTPQDAGTSTPTVLGVIAIVLAAAALGVAVLLRRPRSRADAPGAQ